MKRLLAAAALTVMATAFTVDVASAACDNIPGNGIRRCGGGGGNFRRSRSRDVIVTQPSTGLDLNTLMLLGALGGGGGGVGLAASGLGGGLGILPLLLPQLLAPQQVIIEERRGRRRRGN